MVTVNYKKVLFKITWWQVYTEIPNNKITVPTPALLKHIFLKLIKFQIIFL